MSPFGRWPGPAGRAACGVGAERVPAVIGRRTPPSTPNPVAVLGTGRLRAARARPDPGASAHPARGRPAPTAIGQPQGEHELPAADGLRQRRRLGRALRARPQRPLRADGLLPGGDAPDHLRLDPHPGGVDLGELFRVVLQNKQAQPYDSPEQASMVELQVRDGRLAARRRLPQRLEGPGADGGLGAIRLRRRLLAGSGGGLGPGGGRPRDGDRDELRGAERAAAPRDLAPRGPGALGPPATRSRRTCARASTRTQGYACPLEGAGLLDRHRQRAGAPAPTPHARPADQPVLRARGDRGRARVQAFAEGLAARGHEVEVVCEVPNHPSGVIAPGYRRRGRAPPAERGRRPLRLGARPPRAHHEEPAAALRELRRAAARWRYGRKAARASCSPPRRRCRWGPRRGRWPAVTGCPGCSTCATSGPRRPWRSASCGASARSRRPSGSSAASTAARPGS